MIMIILLFIVCVSVALGYEVIPGCDPKMIPFNGTHCKIEYEHCFKDLKLSPKAFLQMFQDENTTEPVKSNIGKNNLVNVLSVCKVYKLIFLHIDGGKKEPDLIFSYTPNDFKKTIQDYMCYTDNQVSVNMTQFRNERPDQHCLRSVRVKEMIRGKNFTVISEGFISVEVEEELKLILFRGKDGKSVLKMDKKALATCTDKDLIFNIVVGSSISLLFLICAVFLTYCFITTKRIKSAEIDVNSDYGNNDYYIETKATDSNSYYYSNDQEDISYAKERNPEYNKSDDEE